jgi:Uma2 family endonuclease
MEMELNDPALAYNRLDSLEDFLAYAETKEVRLEFFKGQVQMMSSTSKAHSIITCNLNRNLYGKLKGKDCMTFQETVNLKIQYEKCVFLPDIVVTCHPDDLSLNTKFLENPSIIIEVLSPSTELQDRSIKWEFYRKITSLRYYLLVSKDEPKIEIYGRPHAQSLFYFQEYKGLQTTIDLQEMDIHIPMSDIYEGIVFD